jgi:hypothetical protein
VGANPNANDLVDFWARRIAEAAVPREAGHAPRIAPPEAMQFVRKCEQSPVLGAYSEQRRKKRRR